MKKCNEVGLIGEWRAFGVGASGENCHLSESQESLHSCKVFIQPWPPVEQYIEKKKMKERGERGNDQHKKEN